MARFVRGNIVVVNFPFSDLTQFKKKPSLVLENIAGRDMIFCQITSNSYESLEEVEINNTDFIEGKLKRKSYVRFTKLFTGDDSLINYKVGKINQEKLKQIALKLSHFLSKNL